MSRYYMEHGEIEQILDYGESRTKQSFKDSCDVNKILARAQITGAESHLARFGAKYGDFGNFDFAENYRKIHEAERIFGNLPAEVRREFDQDPAEFFEFVNKPENAEKLDQLLPAIAQPGRYFPDTSPSTPPGAPKGAPPPEPETPPPPAE